MVPSTPFRPARIAQEHVGGKWAPSGKRQLRCGVNREAGVLPALLPVETVLDDSGAARVDHPRTYRLDRAGFVDGPAAAGFLVVAERRVPGGWFGWYVAEKPSKPQDKKAGAERAGSAATRS